MRHKLSYDRDQLYLKSCRSAQTFLTRRHKLKFQLVAVSSIVSQGRHTRALMVANTKPESIAPVPLGRIVFSIIHNSIICLIVLYGGNQFLFDRNDCCADRFQIVRKCSIISMVNNLKNIRPSGNGD